MIEIIVALLSLLGVIITAFVGIHKLKKESYNKRVTEERIKWLNIVRDDYSTIMAALELKKAGNNNFYHPQVDKDYYDKKMYDATKAKYDLISRLNTSTIYNNEYNLILKRVLEKITFISALEPLPDEEEIRQFEVFMNLMLENEWRKSKNETK